MLSFGFHRHIKFASQEAVENIDWGLNGKAKIYKSTCAGSAV